MVRELEGDAVVEERENVVKGGVFLGLRRKKEGVELKEILLEEGRAMKWRLLKMWWFCWWWWL